MLYSDFYNLDIVNYVDNLIQCLFVRGSRYEYVRKSKSENYFLFYILIFVYLGEKKKINLFLKIFQLGYFLFEKKIQFIYCI